jgi:hypothetical protein
MEWYTVEVPESLVFVHIFLWRSPAATAASLGCSMV